MTKSRLLLTGVSLACFLPFSALAADAKAGTPITKEEFPAYLKETLIKNPDILLDAIKEMQDKQQAESEKGAKEGIAKHKAAFADEAAPSAGASVKDADVTIVMFFDYHCGYCKHMVAPINQLLNTDKKVRVVFMDYPILSEDSASAGRAAVAVNNIDKSKYFAFYSEAMKHNGKFDDNGIETIAKNVGLDADKVKAEMKKPSVAKTLDKIHDIGKDIGVHGTPAMIVGEDFYPGALSYEEIKKAIDKARSAKK